jgi:hypothetical protein
MSITYCEWASVALFIQHAKRMLRIILPSVASLSVPRFSTLSRKRVIFSRKIIEWFLLGNSPAYEFYVPTFRNTLFHFHRRIGMKMEQSVPKRRYIKFRRRGITREKAYNIQNTAKVWTQGKLMNIKYSYVLWFSLELFFFARFLILRRIERDMIKNVYWSSCKVPDIMSDFNKTWIFWTY